MVLTVEPGLYFGAWRPDVDCPERYANLGIRIEDDVLVTANNPDVLTAACPKTVEEIENITGKTFLRRAYELGIDLHQQAGWTTETAQELRLSPEDALTLYNDAPLHQLMSAAHNRRIAMHGPSKVTYLVESKHQLHHVCTINCQFCSFYRPPGHDETYTQSLEEISGRISALEEIGGVRILMQGGVNPELHLRMVRNIAFSHSDQPSKHRNRLF